ncbi:hypothetical protein RDWZM_007610 [Blomia tropicalis]|uniref:Uncharacterized protein n=1 Tax=Blomia tropicalis TaxID=40697 RepID=A0A9Q0LXR9_BLOTA|nr:hypothetical protein RDWZM_007610 [Blomia tropicalis]
MFPGLAHMLEHMIFMGSNQFPNENDIEHYLSANGGYSNATTECEYTMYELMVERRSLRGAIERFSSAFINPLLSQSSIEQEIEPIDIEFVSAITDDNVRCQLLLTQIANRQHPASKFLWGNRRSLIESKSNERKQDIREQLIKFFNDHYRSNNIVVIVQSQESLENLHNWTCEMFSKIPVSRNTNIISPKLISAPAFEQEQFHRLYRMESIDNGTQLLISWLMSPIISDYQSSPINYLSTISLDFYCSRFVTIIVAGRLC